MAIDAEMDLKVANGGYFLSVRLSVRLPGVDCDTAQALIDEAHEICPYSKASRRNIEVSNHLI